MDFDNYTITVTDSTILGLGTIPFMNIIFWSFTEIAN